jgi:hypothetical protein
MGRPRASPQVLKNVPKEWPFLCRYIAIPEGPYFSAKRIEQRLVGCLPWVNYAHYVAYGTTYFFAIQVAFKFNLPNFQGPIYPLQLNITISAIEG